MTVSDIHNRITFENLELEPLPNERCAGRVALAWRRGEDFVGTAECTDTPPGQLRCAAEATARALELAVENRVALEGRRLCFAHPPPGLALLNPLSTSMLRRRTDAIPTWFHSHH